jgi:N-acetylglutamate synthase-like GNAT family acetyltransferase
MGADPVQITARHDLTPDEIDALEARLYAFNAERTGHRDGAQIAFVVEEDGALIGAVAGYSWGGVCELQQVWVDEAHRGRGLGERLMNSAIEEARSRGCRHVFLQTYDFQAPGFYARLGFVPIAEIRDKPLGRTELVMRLSLAR